MSSEPSIRLTGTSFAVLGMVGYLQPCTPYDLKRFIEQSIVNFWPVPHTTFYVEPARLAAAGYLDERQESSGRRRKLYSLTAAGRQVLQEWLATPTAAPPELRDELELKVFLGADPGPLLGERIRWHQQKLAELEGYLAAAGEGDWPPGVGRSLEAGTTYHRLMIGMIEGYEAEAAVGGETGAPLGRPGEA